jgi:diguanylate cyclase (GGDEF)-like protein/PAS domain S-box-containing protein
VDRYVARLQYRVRHRAGGWVAIEAIGKNLLANPAVQGVIVNGWDVTRRREDEQIGALLREIDHGILEGVAADELLSLICDRLVTLFELALAWIGTTESDGSIAIRAHAGSTSGYLDGLSVRWDDSPEGSGPVAAALRTGRPLVLETQTAPEFARRRERALQHGLRAVAVLPLLAEGEAFGVLSLYATSARSIGPESLEKQAAFANQIAISILHARHQEQIRLETAALEATASPMHITDRRGIIRWVNPAMERLTGFRKEEIVGSSPSLLKSGVHGRAFYRDLWKTILEGETWRGETHNRRQDGSVYIADQTITPVRDASGEIVNFIAVHQDITERKNQDRRILHMAMHDPLTNLPNRRVLEEAVEGALRSAGRGEPSALLLMDVDNFKVINDTVGQSAGDRFLLEIAELLASAIRPCDVLARFGGDEFAILLQGATREMAQNIAERLRDAVGQTRFHENGYTFAPTVTIGIGLLADGESDAATVQALADSALHAGKEAGKNRVVVYQSLTQRESQITTASQWATRIKDAIAEDRLVLFFQPIVRLADGQVSHYEALVRMRDFEGKLILPGVFTAAAERFNLSSTLDHWVFQQVLSLLFVRPDLRIAMNLSGASLGEERLLRGIEEAVEAACLNHNRLIIEITETAAVHNLPAAREWMARLQRLGCSFGLDDFGAGFSSFSSLRSLPVQHLKIDGSYIQLIEKDSSTRAIVQAMADVAHALDKQVVAEWVENDAQLEVLREIGIEYGQGFRWGQPQADIGDMGIAQRLG